MKFLQNLFRKKPPAAGKLPAPEIPPTPEKLPTPAKSSFTVVESNKWVKGAINQQLEGLVELRINEQRLTQVPLVFDGKRKESTFIFRTHVTLLDALPESYTLSAELPNGEILTYPDSSPLGEGDGSLLAKIQQGYLVSAKAGYLYKPPVAGSAWRQDIFKAYEKTREAMADIEEASDVFVAYGVLLGQVRTGDFISYDDDFDAAFLVDANTPKQAAVLFHRIVAKLKAKGIKVTAGSHLGNFHLYFPDLPSIDVFLMYYRESTAELCSFHLVAKCDRDMILPLKIGQLAENDVLIPNKSEELLAATYGANWQTPDPYFQWSVTPRHNALKHAFMSASRAIVNGDSAAGIKHSIKALAISCKPAVAKRLPYQAK